MSRKKALENRELVIEAAARPLRERGLAGVGVAEIMEAAGLTNGGFYPNFTSKYDLAAQAIGRAASTMKAVMLYGLAQLPDEPFRALVEHYTLQDHRQKPGSGCILPALAADAARSDSSALRAVITTVVQDHFDQLAVFASTMPEGPGKRHPVGNGRSGHPVQRVLNDEMVKLLMDAAVTDIAGERQRSRNAPHATSGHDDCAGHGAYARRVKGLGGDIGGFVGQEEGVGPVRQVIGRSSVTSVSDFRAKFSAARSALSTPMLCQPTLARCF